MNEVHQHRLRHPAAAAARAGSNAAAGPAAELNALLADFFVLYMKTKNFHWHVSGPHFRDYHLLFDDQATQIFAATDAIAERVRKIGAPTLHSLGQVGEVRRLEESDAEGLDAQEMLRVLQADNRALCATLRETHALCDELGDVATASLLENWIDEAEQRIWFLAEAGVRT